MLPPRDRGHQATGFAWPAACAPTVAAATPGTRSAHRSTADGFRARATHGPPPAAIRSLRARYRHPEQATSVLSTDRDTGRSSRGTRSRCGAATATGPERTTAGRFVTTTFGDDRADDLAAAGLRERSPSPCGSVQAVASRPGIRARRAESSSPRSTPTRPHRADTTHPEIGHRSFRPDGLPLLNESWSPPPGPASVRRSGNYMELASIVGFRAQDWRVAVSAAGPKIDMVRSILVLASSMVRVASAGLTRSHAPGCGPRGASVRAAPSCPSCWPSRQSS